MVSVPATKPREAVAETVKVAVAVSPVPSVTSVTLPIVTPAVVNVTGPVSVPGVVPVTVAVNVMLLPKATVVGLAVTTVVVGCIPCDVTVTVTVVLVDAV